MAKLTTKKLRLLFCDVVEQFIPLFNQKELEKGIEVAEEHMKYVMGVLETL